MCASRQREHADNSARPAPPPRRLARTANLGGGLGEAGFRLWAGNRIMGNQNTVQSHQRKNFRHPRGCIHHREIVPCGAGAPVEGDKGGDTGGVDALDMRQVEGHALSANDRGQPGDEVLLLAAYQLVQVAGRDEQRVIDMGKNVIHIFSSGYQQAPSFKGEGASGIRSYLTFSLPPACQTCPGAEYAEITVDASDASWLVSRSGCPDSALASAMEHVANRYADRTEKFPWMLTTQARGVRKRLLVSRLTMRAHLRLRRGLARPA